MHKLLKIAVLVGLSVNLSHAFDQLPVELINNLVSFEPHAMIVLSGASSAIHKVMTLWAQEKDKSILAFTFESKMPSAVRFVLQHNKKINDVEVATFTYAEWSQSKVKDEMPCTFLRALSSVRPWAVQRSFFIQRAQHEKIDRGYLDRGYRERMTNNGFLIPLYYSPTKATPILHALIKSYFLHSSEDEFKRLLKSGMNPFYMHEGKTVLTLIDADKSAPPAIKEAFKKLCMQHSRTPNDPQIVMYHGSQLLTMAMIEKIACGE